MRNLSRAEHLAAWLCGMGILLGCGGVWAMRHVPLTPEEEVNERKLQQVFIPLAEDVARQRPNDPNAKLMLDELRSSSVYYRRPPPYRTEGIAALAAGIGSFVAGVVIWFRYSARWRRSRWVKVNEDV